MRLGTLEDRDGAIAAVELFEYPALPGLAPEPAWYDWEDTGEEAATTEPEEHPEAQTGPDVDVRFEARLAEETRRAFEAGRERGMEEGRRVEREALTAAAAAEAEQRRRQRAELVEGFERASDHYLRAVEPEVVRLALAVAARILRREAQMDPLLLTGAVRVALGQLASASEVRLHVPAREADLWRETVAHLPNLVVKPLVVAEEKMHLGECRIESKVGSVDLGIRAQLSEIERGFFDRAGAAPASGTGAVAGPKALEADAPWGEEVRG